MWGNAIERWTFVCEYTYEREPGFTVIKEIICIVHYRLEKGLSLTIE